MNYYLLINCVYLTTGIKHEFGDYIKFKELRIPDELFERIQKLTKNYEKIIPMGKWLRRANYTIIFELDKEGYAIKEDMEKLKNCIFKVKYYSHGLEKILFAPPRIDDYMVDLNFWDKLIKKIDNFLTIKKNKL